MAAPKKNLLSLGHLTGTERKTKQRDHRLQNSKVMHLQRRWEELKERELAAQKHNKQLLQQFDRAQDALREMLACNAAMRTIRMEYERYLEENAPRWQQQFKEKTQAAQKKRMEEYLRSYLKKTKPEQKSSADQPTLSYSLARNAQKVSTLQKDKSSYSDYKQDVSSHHPFIQSSWLAHSSSPTARFPFRAPSHLQGLSHVPPSYLPPPPLYLPPHQFLHQPFDSTSPHHHPWPRQNPPCRGSPQPDYPWSGSTGAAGFFSNYEALWGPLYVGGPRHERGEEAETSTAPSSKRRSNGSRNSSLSQELDIKPVRLSSGHAESSESSGDSIQTSRGKRKKKEKRGKNSDIPSERGRCSSQNSLAAGVPAVQGSECDSSSDKRSISVSRRTRTRSRGVAVGSPKIDEVPTEMLKNKKDNSRSKKEENYSTDESGSHNEEIRSENALNPSPDDKPDTWTEEESESVSIKIENEVAEKEKQKRSSTVEERSSEENNLEGDDSDGEEKDRLRNEGEDETDEDEDEDTGTEDELEDQGDDEGSLKNEEGKNRRQGFANSQDEEVDKNESEPDEDEDRSVDRDEEEGDEEQRSDEVEEDRESDDSIISPQANRLKKMHSIPEEAAEDDQLGSSDENSNGLSEDDIEDLLAPQDQTKKEEKNHLKIDTKSEATCDNVEIFQVELDDLAKTKDQSDSEFDHFYD